MYEYKPEDGSGIDPSQLHNKNRTNGNEPFTNTYLKRVRYGNHIPYTNQGDVFPAADQFFFETVFDYGEHEVTIPFNETSPWAFRPDAFSAYRSGFEIRTCRLCKRVLLYHHFNELPGGEALVRSMAFVYDNNGQDGFSFLKEIMLTGYTKHDDGSYTQKSLPPYQFSYQKHNWNTDVNTISAADAGNLPMGIDEESYLFVDLYNEGLSGILTEQSDAWFYKNNLGGGQFSPTRVVMAKPSFSGLGANLQLLELESNGTKQVVNWQMEPKGFF